MEIRKVQVTGGSSYVITLPKEWIKENKIEKNHPLGIITQPEGSLLITSNTEGEKQTLQKVFNVDNINDSTYLFRLLIGAYIMGYTSIEVCSKNKLEAFVRDCVMEFTQTVIGPEIIEETNRSIIIKDLLNPAEMPFDNSIKRMHILVRTMHEDVILALNTKDLSLIDDVISRDKDVDRLQWLIARQSNIVMKDIVLSKKWNVSKEEATFYFMMSRIIERVGDHAVRIAKIVPTLIEKKVEGEVVNKIARASEVALGLFATSLAAWNSKDLVRSNKNIESVEELKELCEEINDTALQVKGIRTISISYIAESIMRTGEYSSDISELAINYLINK